MGVGLVGGSNEVFNLSDTESDGTLEHMRYMRSFNYSPLVGTKPRIG